MPLFINTHLVTLQDPGPGALPVTEFIIEFQGLDTAEARWTEADQTDPAGRFRWKAVGGEFQLHRATSAQWATWDVMMTVGAADGGVDFVVADPDEQLFALQGMAFEVDRLYEIVQLICA